MNKKNTLILITLGWLIAVLLLVNFYRLSNPYGVIFWAQMFGAITLAVMLFPETRKILSENEKISDVHYLEQIQKHAHLNNGKLIMKIN